MPRVSARSAARGRRRRRRRLERGEELSPRRKLLVAAALLVEPVALRARGLPIGGNLVVRCRSGHLFTTLWVPSVSVKALRFGWWRLQWCPVGRHFTLVTPVRESQLSEGQRSDARARHDLRLP